VSFGTALHKVISPVNGTILIDKNNNTGLFDTLKANIKFSAKLFEDSDEDGSLEPSEKGEDDILAQGEELQEDHLRASRVI